MPNLLAMSFEAALAPSFDLKCLKPGRTAPDGWGIGYYPGGEPAATVLKEPAPTAASIRSEIVRAWDHLASSLFVAHIRRAQWGQISIANTQPLLRSYAGRDWLIAHSGSLRARLELPPDSRFLPVGSTDTEGIFCDILNRIAAKGWQSLGDIDPEKLRRWFDGLNERGGMTSVLTDGRDLVVYADARGDGGAFIWRILPPYGQVAFGDADLEIDLTLRGVKSSKGIVVSSDSLGSTTESPADFVKLAPGHLLVIRQGAVRAEVARPESSAPASFTGLVSRPALAFPRVAEPRRLSIYHRTSYRYDRPVERSTHLLRLQPVHDRLQSLRSHEVTISVEGQQRLYEDVFGNQARRLVIDRPFQELVIEARSVVDVLDTDPLSFRPLHERSMIPLVWMPWQRHMLAPFLLPPELPESELHELIEYAMSFVERNEYDLLDTLLDLNMSIFKDYEYRKGSTTVFSTPYDCYVQRHGVCQDFTNLFICLARLLGIPARYVCGYIHPGPTNPNQVQSEASHAWVQVYLPEVGWKGFDPTNGILTQTDHVRVAVGRRSIDATPTSGTIFVGGGTETLEVEVKVEVAPETAAG